MEKTYLIVWRVWIACMMWGFMGIMIVQAQRVYVKEGATGKGTGWEDALGELWQALDSARVGKASQIWIAAGTYLPNTNNLNDKREASFQLVSGVNIYGGFKGEQGEDNLSVREPDSNKVILSGDLERNDSLNIFDDNSFHVVIAENIVFGTTLDGVTISGGNATGKSGGGLRATMAQLLLKNSIIESNTAQNGGGISFTSSFPILTNCTIRNNIATLDGGGIHYSSGNDLGSNININDCEFTGNRARKGGGMFIQESKLSINNSDFLQNTSVENGGGIYVNKGDPLNIKNSGFKRNKAQNGGGLYSDFSINNLQNCIFKQDSSRFGGGIFQSNGSSSTFDQCWVDSSKASRFGGGVYSISSRLSANACTFSSNEAVFRGGAIFLRSSGDSELINCTVSQNMTTSSRGDGGGIYLNGNSNLNIYSNTITKNNADEGASFYLNENSNIKLKGSLIADNGNPLSDIEISNGKLTSEGYNLIEDTSSSIETLETDILGIDQPLFLDSLTNNGGPTPTHALLEGSPAIGKGEPLNVASRLLDQRGYSRFIGTKFDSIDIGAYEFQHTFVNAPAAKQLCNVEVVNIEDIVISDPTGGAWPEEDSVTFVLEFDQAVEINKIDSVSSQGPSIQILSYVVEENQIKIAYQKVYENSINQLHSIIIHGLQVQTVKSGKFTLIRAESNNPASQPNNGIMDSVKHAVFTIFPTVGALDFPYEKDFDQDSADWQIDLTQTNSIWKWNPLDSTKSVDSTINAFWHTRMDTAYGPKEDSWVFSPCFDLNALKRPMIEMEIWSATQAKHDGAVFEYSCNNGEDWRVLGTDKLGWNWYQRESSNISTGRPTSTAQLWLVRDSRGWGKIPAVGKK